MEKQRLEQDPQLSLLKEVVLFGRTPLVNTLPWHTPWVEEYLRTAPPRRRTKTSIIAWRRPVPTEVTLTHRLRCHHRRPTVGAVQPISRARRDAGSTFEPLSLSPLIERRKRRRSLPEDAARGVEVLFFLQDLLALSVFLRVGVTVGCLIV